MPNGGIPFGQYTLLRRIARGGMAEVFLAKQRGLEGFDRRVAVKRILPHLSDSTEFVQMFLAEARLAAKLTHPNIVHIYEFGKVQGDYFIAMEFVAGIHSGQIIASAASKPLPLGLVARIGADAASALHYAHNLTSDAGLAIGLVHRDISPANIMVTMDGTVKLVDFGIAKAMAGTSQGTSPGMVKGKFTYMSPEQTMGHVLDGRSDVFSLAIVLSELIAGRSLIDRTDPAGAMRAIRDGNLPEIDAVLAKTPSELQTALRWAFETNAQDRATALELAHSLESYIKSSPELATAMQLGTWIQANFSAAQTTAGAVFDGGDATGAANAAKTSGTAATASAGKQRAGTDVAPLTGAIADPGTALATSSETPRARSASPAPRVSMTSPAPPPPNPFSTQPPTRRLTDQATRPVSKRHSTPYAPDTVPVELAEASTTVFSPSDTNELDETSLVVRGLDTVPAATPPKPTASLERYPRRASADAPTVTIDEAALRAVSQASAQSVVNSSKPSIPPKPSQRAPVPRAPRTANVKALPIPQTRGHELEPLEAPALRKLPSMWLLGLLVVAAAGAGLFINLRTPDVSTLATLPGSTEPLVDAAPLDQPFVAPPLPAPDAPPPPSTATVPSHVSIVEITTNVSNATVYFDERSGSAPARFESAPGPHRIVAEAPGYERLAQTITLEGGKHEKLQLQLTAQPTLPMGTLAVKTIPASDVYEGSRKLGRTPIELDLIAGQHKLTFRVGKRRPVMRKVKVRANQRDAIELRLR